MATNMGIYGTSIKALFVLTPSGSRWALLPLLVTVICICIIIIIIIIIIISSSSSSSITIKRAAAPAKKTAVAEIPHTSVALIWSTRLITCRRVVVRCLLLIMTVLIRGPFLGFWQSLREGPRAIVRRGCKKNPPRGLHRVLVRGGGGYCWRRYCCSKARVCDNKAPESQTTFFKLTLYHGPLSKMGGGYRWLRYCCLESLDRELLV